MLMNNVLGTYILHIRLERSRLSIDCVAVLICICIMLACGEVNAKLIQRINHEVQQLILVIISQSVTKRRQHGMKHGADLKLSHNNV
jgi:hypothetical protein